MAIFNIKFMVAKPYKQNLNLAERTQKTYNLNTRKLKTLKTEKKNEILSQ